jgi:protein SCO1
MPRRILILATVAAGLAIVVLQLVAWRLVAHRPPGTSPIHGRPRDPKEPLPTLWPVPQFALVDQNGQKRTPEELRGSVWIADFIFTRCSSVCPVLSAKMVQVQRAIPDPRLKFVSFSVDPERDTPEALRDYARRWAPNESRWTLLATTKQSLAGVAAGMKTHVEAQPDPNATLHTSAFFLVDAQGRVRGLYDTDGDSFAQLVPDARRLVAELSSAPPMSAAAESDGDGDGAALYGRLGCAGCHDVAVIAPSLAGIAGRAVMLTDGRTLIADAAYLRESILDPNKSVVATYPPTMPSYRSQLSEAQLVSLVHYLEAWTAPAAGIASRSVPGEGVAVDPVCGMQVHPGPETLHVMHEGHAVYFCSEQCRDRFMTQPAKFRQ